MHKSKQKSLSYKFLSIFGLLFRGVGWLYKLLFAHARKQEQVALLEGKETIFVQRLRSKPWTYKSKFFLFFFLFFILYPIL